MTTMPLLLDDRLRSILDSPGHVALQGPGGYGKTAILRTLPDHDIVADDAHLLDAAELRRLRELALTGDRRVVVAFRPWPRTPELTALAEQIRRRGTLVLLGPFSQAQTTRLVAESGDRAHAQTCGIPGLVARWAAAPDEVQTLIQLATEVEHLSTDVRDLLTALATGADLPVDLLRALLRQDDLDQTLSAARATGYLGPDNRIPPLVRRAIARFSPVAQRDDLWHRLADLMLDRGVSVLPLARSLHTAGVGGSRFALVFEAAALEALNDDPAVAAQLFGAARAGGAAAAVAQAQAQALSGDLDGALRLADRLVASDPPARSQAAAVAATALVHRGQLTRGAELYRWSGTPAAAAFAAIAAAATGRPESVSDLPESSGDAPPTLLDGASRLMADGVTQTLTGSPIAAMSAFAQACALLEPAGQGQLLPDSPAALAALAGLHCGEFAVALSILDRASASRLGGPLLAPRHRLLRAWIDMTRGRTASAAEQFAEAAAEQPRDLLFAAALQVGLARRNSDLTGMQSAWDRAREAIMQHPVDLFTLLPLGELAIAAARLSETARISTHISEADRLLTALDEPALWTAPWRWSRLHAAIIAEERAGAAEHAAALDRTRGSGFTAGLADAACIWLEVVEGKVDADKVAAAARTLHDLGLSWDGARLAGQAAIRTSDRRAMTALLDCARVLQGRPAAHKGQPEPAAHARALGLEDAARLSGREQEVAQLVLAGLTYKQVGDQLFISAKTVEHHVARMRQRLNCSSRGELLARLRSMPSLTTQAAPVRLPSPRRPTA